MSRKPLANQVPDQVKPKWNITPRFKPGQSGNPSGRPKGVSIIAPLYKFALQVTEKKNPYTGRQMTWAERIALATLKYAEKGNPKALDIVWDRIEGKMKQEIDINVESQLWQRLNQGRLRVSAVKQTVTLQAPNGAQVTIEESMSSDPEDVSSTEIVQVEATTRSDLLPTNEAPSDK